MIIEIKSNSTLKKDTQGRAIIMSEIINLLNIFFINIPK